MLRFIYFLCFTTVIAQNTLPDPQVKVAYYIQKIEDNIGTLLHLRYSDSLLFIAKEHQLIDRQVLALTNKGIYYKNMGQLEKGLDYYLQALELCKEIPENYKMKAVTMVNLGNLYDIIGEIEKSIKTMKDLLIFVEPYPDNQRVKMGVYNSLGTSYSKLADNDKALEYYTKVKEMAEMLGSDKYLIVILNNIADLHIQNGDYHKGIAIAEESLLINKNHINIKGEAWSYFNLGNGYLKLKETKTAIEYLLKARGISVENEYKKNKMYVHRLLAQAYELNGDFKKSYEEQKLYTAFKEENLKESSGAVTLELKNESEAKDGIINDLSKSVETEENSKKNIIWGGILLGLLMTFVLIFLFRKKQLTQKQKEKLKEDYKVLSDELLSMKVKMQNLAQKNHDDQLFIQDTENTSKHKKLILTEKEREEYMNRILDVMESEKPYLDADIKQADLAEMLSMSIHHLSEVLNYTFGQNFNNFINIYRLENAKKLLKDPEYNDQKIIAVAYDSGFHSKASFNRVFKDYVGQTPSLYKES